MNNFEDIASNFFKDSFNVFTLNMIIRQIFVFLSSIEIDYEGYDLYSIAKIKNRFDIDMEFNDSKDKIIRLDHDIGGIFVSVSEKGLTVNLDISYDGKIQEIIKETKNILEIRNLFSYCDDSTYAKITSKEVVEMTRKIVKNIGDINKKTHGY